MAVGDLATSLDLDSLRERIGDCRECALGQTRTKLVFGVGDPCARLMFIGEAPGRNEDAQGEPFVGAAGKLLDELLASIDLSREEVYIANVLKCRPPGNRDPESEEIETCTPLLARQVQLIDPRVIATLGRFATQYVLDTAAPITSLRGRLYRVAGRQVVPIFHPAVALYDAKKKPVLFEDFQRLRAILERPEDSGGDEMASTRLGPPRGSVQAPVVAVHVDEPPPLPGGRPSDDGGSPEGDADQMSLF